MKIGDELTVNSDTIDNSGAIHFRKGQKVKVSEIVKTEAHWSNFYNIWIKEVIHGVKLENEYGIYFLLLFEETNLKPTTV